MTITNRSIPVCIILTLITFGIYGIYWFIKLTDETNALAPNNATTSGGKAFLLTIVTLGIYGIYWNYKLGAKVDEMNGISNGNTGLLYLIISLLGGGLISSCLAQNVLNQKAAA